MQLLLTACAANRITGELSRLFWHEDPTFPLQCAQVVLYFLIHFMEYAALDGRRLQARTSALFNKVRIVCFISSFHKPVGFSWRCTMTSFPESTSYASRGLEPTSTVCTRNVNGKLFRVNYFVCEKCISTWMNYSTTYCFKIIETLSLPTSVRAATRLREFRPRTTSVVLHKVFTRHSTSGCHTYFDLCTGGSAMSLRVIIHT